MNTTNALPHRGNPRRGRTDDHGPATATRPREGDVGIMTRRHYTAFATAFALALVLPSPDVAVATPSRTAPVVTVTNSAVVVDWSRIVFEAAMTDDGYVSFMGTRHQAMMHIAMHDALNAIDPRFDQYAYFGRSNGANPIAAAAEGGARRARGGLSRPAGDAGRRARDLARDGAQRPRQDQGSHPGSQGGGGHRRAPSERWHGRRPLQPQLHAGHTAG